MSQKGFSALIVALVAVVIGWGSLYVVSERERAVQLRFGELVGPNIEPGLHFKFPFVDNIRIFDARLQHLEVPSERFLTLEQKAVIVDSYIKWRIADVASFYKATAGDLYRANTLLSQRAESRLRNKVGGLTLNEVVSGQRDSIMSDITNELDEVARKELGVTVVDVRVKRVDLPPQVSDSVFERMSSEREKEAQEFRSKGQEMAEGIQANADREQRIIQADAYKQAEIIRGNGDAKAAEVYASAYNRDSEFYAFHRSLQAYKQSFSDSGDIMLLEPNNDFFKYLNKKSGN
ncbi:protease modulator HflC [Endozoicomonas sp. OPT23]|uniref:protease modulator HflC n=1 Tax=Endozoicomonas sp. OPT23 TaxID=2072845 RepID=UPI00129BD374|nr:protease modulator HflC [Endozoicomonas sp. OPT23]MRI31680.1 protease modulator HflC [Endozoicomonas sp. OPT23]